MQPDLAIALLALLTAVLSAYATRVHNRLSVRPYVSLHLTFAGDRVLLLIRNSGTGPAIIEKITATVGELQLDPTTEAWTTYLYLEFRRIMLAHRVTIPNSDITTLVVCCMMDPKQVLAPNQEFMLIESERRLTRMKAIDAIYRYLDTNMDVEISYASIYHEKFRYDLHRRRGQQFG